MKLLIVNNNDNNLKILNLILSKDNYEIRTANTCENAIDKLTGNYDAIILDSVVDGKSGVEICEEIKKSNRYNDAPIILISSDVNIDGIIKGFASGISDYITIPFSADEVRKRIKTQLELRNNPDKTPQLEAILSLSKLAQSKDDDCGNHLERIKRYCEVLATELQKPLYQTNIDDKFIRNLILASPLHDIGKVKLPDEILDKQTALTADEFEKMKTHTVMGYNMLKSINDRYKDNELIKMAMDIALNHHERYDGGGYPYGVEKENIPLTARIVAVADVYDALRTKKPYKDSLSHEKSFEVIKGGRELQFDYLVVKALKKVHTKFEEIWNELGD